MAIRIADLTPGDPAWWLNTLENRLLQRQAHMLELDSYYRGEHPLPFLTKAHHAKMRDEFSRLLTESRSNFMRLVVDATEERMRVDGFRLSAESDPTADAQTWELWQANCMDAQSQTAFLEALVKGVSYLSVWEDEDEDGYPDINIEDPLQTVVAYVPGSNYRRRAAALKVWLDDVQGVRRANVYLPDAIYKFQGPSDVQPTWQPTVPEQIEIPWSAMPDATVQNPLMVVPIIPLRNRPRLLVEGESELEDVFRVQNQINALTFLLALAGYFGAHRQRWAVGLTLHEDDKGRPVEPFNIAVDRLIVSEDSNTTFGEFSQTDLSGYIAAIEQKVLHIAVTTRTPRHYLIQQGQSPSGDAIQSAESGLIKKVERKQRTFGEGLEEALTLARRFGGDSLPASDAPVDSEIVWADPQTHTLGVVTDAVIKQFLGGLIPKAFALERLGFSQTEIRRILSAQPDEFASPAPDIPSAAQRTDVLRNLPAGA